MKKRILFIIMMAILGGCQTASMEPITYNDAIILFSPLTDQFVSSPLLITGEARGTWFFEGTFPITIVNWDGLIIGESYATAQKNWMTEDFVPFTAQIEFTKPTVYDYGALILQKDNPSGLPQYDDALEIPIKFK